MADAMKSQVTSIQFTKEDAVLLAHCIWTEGDTPESERKISWAFNMPQIASQNQLALPAGDDVVRDYFADSDSDRDVMAEQLLDAVLAGRAKAKEISSQVANAFASALSKINDVEHA